ncbi:MAG: 4'-phosphopantetheinyl transferase superfamily protein, partial [Deltaproteobacteria bacterium]|nr:4'-phosphopantetheinyl transferase superfamily protein [Deltaproteobacteria bacterium]
EDALRDGDRVYAVLRGVGTSSDGRGGTLMSPAAEGQAAAMRAAWAGLDPSAVGLIEAHGTGTPAGDAVELESLRRVFGGAGEAPPAYLGSVKSMIGHAMPAAGAAGLIKAALALYHGVLPPTLGAEEPHPALAASRFALPAEARAWPRDLPRLAGVSAFGFGGVNAHVALEAPPAARAAVSLRPLAAHLSESRHLLALAAPSAEGLAGLLEGWAARLEGAAGDAAEDAAGGAAALARSTREGEGDHRAALLDPTPRALRELAAAARGGGARGGRGGGGLRARGALCAQEGAPPPRVAWMFPGVEATFAPRVDDLCARLGLPAPALPPAGLGGGEEGAAPLDRAALGARGIGVVRLGLALARVLERVGVPAHDLCGHSVGEWAGLVAAGFLDEGEVERFIGGLEPRHLEVPDVAFVAVGASRARAEELLAPLGLTPAGGVFCSHDNCPHQSVLCAPPAAARAAVEALTRAQVLARDLPFRSGFHAPYFQPHADALSAHLDTFALRAPHTPLWSATALAPYPAGRAAVRALSARHLVETVRFRELTEALYASGARAFVQVGVGSLASFVSDTLRGRPHVAVEAHSERLGAHEQLLRLCAALFAEGLDVRVEALQESCDPPPRALALRLGVPFVRLPAAERGLLRGARAPAARPVSDVGAWRGAATCPGALAPAGEDTWRGEWSVSVEEQPHLLDHCFFRQPAAWPHVRDRFPVVPMTLSLQWVMEAAQALCAPGERVVGARDVRASRWVEAAPAQRLAVEARRLADDAAGRGALEVTLKGHLSAVAITARAPLAPPPAPPLPLRDERPSPVRGAQIYEDRWMFHGPAYYGVHEVTALSPDGIRGVLRCPAAPGALLDAVGQLFGLWVMLTAREDRVVMPVSLEEVLFYGPPPPPGALLPCAVWVERLDRREARARMCVWRDGRVWATLAGWRDWRFETSGALWDLMRYPERALYARPLVHTPALTLTLAEGVSAAASSREFLVGRCLTGAERDAYRALAAPRQQGWLAGRIAAKDAARAARWAAFVARHPAAPPPALFPVEVAVEPTASGAPRFGAGAGEGLWLSITHAGGAAVAAVSARGPVGVDLEPVAAREDSWARAAFSDAERARLEALAPPAARPLLLTAAWCAKEAAAKALDAGLGAPRAWEVLALSGAAGAEGAAEGAAEVRAPSGARLAARWRALDVAGARCVLALCEVADEGAGAPPA